MEKEFEQPMHYLQHFFVETSLIFSLRLDTVSNVLPHLFIIGEHGEVIRPI